MHKWISLQVQQAPKPTFLAAWYRRVKPLFDRYISGLAGRVGRQARGEAVAQHGVSWCEPGTSLPCLRSKLRYTVPVRDPKGTLVPMEWRPAGVGKLPMLAQDMGHPEVAEGIRRALSEY